MKLAGFYKDKCQGGFQVDEQLKELKEMNKTISSIRTFIIAEAQLIKTLCLESQKQGRDIQKIKLIMEKKWQQQ